MRYQERQSNKIETVDRMRCVIRIKSNKIQTVGTMRRCVTRRERERAIR